MYPELFSCKNKKAVVMGGAGLIGNAVSQALLEFGAEVTVLDLKKPNGSFNFVPADISDESQLKTALNQIVAKDPIHIFINCSYPRTQDWGLKFEKIPLDSWNENMRLQVGTCFLATQIVAEHMKNHKTGSIINIGSTYGVVGPSFDIYDGTEMTVPAAYSAIKGGIINFTRYLAAYYGQHGLRINCISPGGIADKQPEAFVEKYNQKTPLGRMGQPQEIATAAVYLASEAASYVTGHNLMVDGGWTAW